MEELIDAEPELARNWSADGFTPLHYAAFFGQEDAARILLERGAEVRGRRAQREHPRDAAAQRRRRLATLRS